MRDIKFRAWNSIDGAYVEWHTLKGMPILLSKMMQGREKHYFIEQFTGFKDYNGVDIYEGDIVDCSTSSPLGEIEQQSTVTASFDYGDLVALHCSDQQFVIGNIHQNPDLIINT